MDQAKDPQIVRHYTFDYSESEMYLNDCLKEALKYGPCTITKNDINELAHYLDEAVTWAREFDNSLTTKQKIKQLQAARNSLKAAIKFLGNLNPKIAQEIMDAELGLQIHESFIGADRAQRHFRPYRNKKSGDTITIAEYEKFLKNLGDPNSIDGGKPKIRDTKEKPFNNFFHTANKILGKNKGKEVFLGLIYDKVYRNLIDGQPPTNQDPNLIFKKHIAYLTNDY